MSPLRHLGPLVGLAVVASACGATNFVRAPSAHRYAALPPTTDVTVVPTAGELPAPTEELGTLNASSNNGEEDRKSVEGQFRVLARRYGCDVIAEVTPRDDPHKSTRTVKKAQPDGKVVDVREEVVTHIWQWSARCIRTAKYGLQAQEKAQVATADEAPPVPVTPPETAPETPAEPCARVAADTRDLCLRLDHHTAGLLRPWKDKLHVARPDAIDMVQAFAELIVQVTGPAGFWRKTLPTQWFGCTADATTVQCERLSAASGELKKFDQLAEQMVAVPPGQAAGWLARHDKQLLDYLETYVPDELNWTSAQATGFYKARLQ